MKKLSNLLIISLLLCGCGNQKLNLPANDEKTVGLNSLTTINEGENLIFLQDFILNCGEIDSVTCSAAEVNINIADDKKTAVLVAEKSFPTFANLTIWVKNVPIAVPLRRSDKIDYTFKFNPEGKTYNRVQIAGQMNNWVASMSPDLQLNSDGIYEVTLHLSPGTYLYQLALDGEQNHDPINPNKVDNGMGKFNSILQVAGNEHKFPHLTTKNISEKYFTLCWYVLFDGHAENIEGTGCKSVPTFEIFAYWENYRLPEKFIFKKENDIKFIIPEEAKQKEFSHIRVWAANSYGISNDILIPLKNGKIVANAEELAKNDNYSKIIYFLLADRFMNGSTANDHPMNRPDVNVMVDYQGGDLVGIEQKISDNYFKNLGINTLWISPLNQNPLEPYAYTELGKSKFSGYHGYWPISSSKVDFRFGTNEELKSLVQTAHNQNISVLLDYVANHVHQNHPFYQKHPEFATSMYLPDGRRNLELWDEQRLTTWFDTFIPTIDFFNPEVVEIMSDSAIFWVKEFGIDGFRHDACKHVNEEFWRLITLKIKQLNPNGNFYQIGESYGSPELVSSYINSGMLNGQFDFNVYDEATSAFNGVSGGTLNRINNILHTSFKVYGTHNLMGNISGNHDKPRFMALASGDLKVGEDAKAAAWTKKIGITDSTAYSKLALFHVFNLTIPGVPVIYYGDEIGMTGANDPDSRRMMHFDFNAREQNLFDIVSKTAHLRTSNMALLYGDFINIAVTENSWVYARKYFDNEAIIVINNSDKEKTFEVELPKSLAKKSFETLFKNNYSVKNNVLKITLGAYEAEVLY
jgi:glycosidase